MILGILSDIHSNLWTLQDVLKENSRVDQWICLGDFTGLLPMVNETINLLVNHKVICIRGDHETCLITNTVLKQSFSGTEALVLQRQIVPKETKKWIQALPIKRVLRFDKRTLLLTHNLTGSLIANKYIINLKHLEQKYNTMDIVMFGHTHLPFYWEGKQTQLLNPGSLGFPVSKTKQGTYATVDTETLHTEFHWIDVHPNDCIRSLENHIYPKRIIDIIQHRML